jgi:hypothetical protein
VLVRLGLSPGALGLAVLLGRFHGSFVTWGQFFVLLFFRGKPILQDFVNV